MERVDEKSDSDKCVDDFMLPGFRFHPTDEELVEFYLKRKLQHRSLPIELIKQVDIYKYDPWDLPKLASTGEKEWYFYCPRDRKYRNSTRPNRVTGSGFWKATGTDRPIYASDGPKCIGLKKSLVFYRGRAAKGIKTDWMMHEFRLPSATDGGAPPPPPPKKPFDKSFPPTDSWAICRIFKKASSTANRALSHTWTASLAETTSSEAFTYTHFSPESDFHHAAFYKNPAAKTPPADVDYFPSNLVFSEEPPAAEKSTADLTSMFFNQSAAETCKNSGFEAAAHHHFNGGGGGYSFESSSQVIQASSGGGGGGEGDCRKSNPNVWENIRTMGFPFSLPLPAANQDPWESPPCPSEMSSTSVTYRL